MTMIPSHTNNRQGSKIWSLAWSWSWLQLLLLLLGLATTIAITTLQSSNSNSNSNQPLSLSFPVAESWSPSPRSGRNDRTWPTTATTATATRLLFGSPGGQRKCNHVEACVRPTTNTDSDSSSSSGCGCGSGSGRREVLNSIASGGAALGLKLTTAITATATATITAPLPSLAYDADPDKLQESLYFISRVQEATVQQERFIRKVLLLGSSSTPGTTSTLEVEQLEVDRLKVEELELRLQQLRTKLKLTLRLIDKNYKLLDQINFSSAYVTPRDNLVEASEAGYEAVDALQGAIEFVNKDDNWIVRQKDNKNNSAVAVAVPSAVAVTVVDVLTTAMATCREQLTVYTSYMPADKLRNARYRVEDENVRNRDEFDGDEDAGVYNPVNLPWKPVK